MSIAAAGSGMAVPPLLTALDDYRAAGAVRYLSSRILQTRMEAVSRSANAAIQFVEAVEGYSFAVYLDRNGDGVRTSDIAQGIDVRLGAIERLPDNYAGVDSGVVPGLPPVDGG